MSAEETTQIDYFLTIDDGPSTESGTETHVLQFDVDEGISELFRVDLLISYADVELDLDGLMGKDAVLTLSHDEGDRHFHGVVIEAEELEETTNFTRYRIRLAPRMWLLGHRRDSRIFQDKTTPEILLEVLAEAGISGARLDDRTNADFEPRNYCVQYRESSLNFVCRLMEEDGICFWFEHAEDDHVLVLADDSADFVSIADPASLVFEPPGLGGVAEQHVWRFRPLQRIRPGKATLIDYSFKQPTQEMEVAEDGSHDTDLEIYDFPGGYVDAGLGTNLARIRHEELQVQRKVARGQSTVLRLVAGQLFELSDHPNDNLNIEYLVLRVHHFGRRTDPGAGGVDNDPEYRNQFDVMPSEVVYRPPRITRVPRISGIQTAIVTGPDGEEIYVDEFGRVKVQFHWDRLGEMNDQSSCWVRVSQGWAGTGFGHVYLPRIGQEVIIQFIEGDPDRPLVTGRVYNGDNALPYPLPDNKTRSTIKSNSTPGGGGSNEFRFEDKSGQEEIYLHGQKDWNSVIENDVTAKIGNNESDTVGADRSRSVGNDENITIGNNQKVVVTTDHTQEVGNDRTRDVGNNEKVTVGTNRNLDVGVDQAITVGSNLTMDVGTNQTETVGGDKKQTVSGSLDVHVDGMAKEYVALQKQQIVGIDYDTKVGGAARRAAVGMVSDTAGASWSAKSGKWMALQSAQTLKVTSQKDMTIKSDANTKMEAKETIEIEGMNIIIDGGESIILKQGPAQIELKGGNVTIKGSKVSMTSTGKTKIKGSGIAEN